MNTLFFDITAIHLKFNQNYDLGLGEMMAERDIGVEGDREEKEELMMK